MKFSKKFISLFFISLAFACTYKYDGDNPVINDVIKSQNYDCLLYTSPSPRDGLLSRMPSSA